MKKLLAFILICIMSLSVFASCGSKTDNSASGDFPPDMPPQESQTGAGGSTSTDGSTGEKTDSEKTDIPDDLPDNADTLAISCSEGTNNCWTTDGQTLTFTNLSADTVCSVSGEFNGAIVINGGDDYKFELELCGVTLYSGEQNPVTVLSGDKVTITAKKGTKNYIYDTRKDVSSDETAYSSAIYAETDLDIGGKGELIVISSENNGIHTKDDLSVKNLTLSVTCEDNALKGNDSVSISGGILTLIAKTGDGIKTTNTDVSSKGKQRGTVSISGGTVNIYAACDGIDAAYNAEVSGEAILNIYTDRYSPYSDTVEKTESTRYIRYTSDSYKFSVKYMSGDDYKWVNASLSKTVNGGRNTYYYYTFDKLENYETMQLFIYSSAQEQGQENEYVAKTDNISWNDSYDTFAIQSRGSSLSYNWANYSTSTGDFGGGPGGEFGGNPGGMGGNPDGMAGGNTETGDYSTKGIKADNEVLISGGTITVNSYDDSIHTNNDVTLENGETATGNVIISGGSLTLFSKDDGIHADGTLTVSGGTVVITGSYEGLEGTFVKIQGGDISIVSSDDGINATTTSGAGISFEDGKVYVYAGGDGVDSNSRTSYQGIVFAGGEIIIIGTSGGNSAIDTEQGYTYSGGTVLALCPANGMGSEVLNCKNFSSIGTKANLNLSQGQTLDVTVNNETVISVTMPCRLSALVIFLGSQSASFLT